MAILFQVAACRFVGALTLLALATAAFGAEPAKTPKPKPAKIKISGYGIVGDRQLRRMLVTLELAGKKPPFFTSAFVEDAALILSSRIKRDGFLNPAITIHMRLEGGARLETSAEDLLANPLPRAMHITWVQFKIRKGVLYYYKSLEFTGLETVPEKQARSYFVETEILLNHRRARIFTPDRLQRGVGSVLDVLDRQGYKQATVRAAELLRDDKSGAVSVRIQVVQGPKFVVRSVREQLFYEAAIEPKLGPTVHPNKPYSRLWVQDFTLSLKTNMYHQGYPDATVDMQQVGPPSLSNPVEVDLLANVKSGPRVWVGSINFKGNEKTRSTLLSRRVRIKRGDLLNPIRTDEGRSRLARLGVFDSVDLDYVPVDEHTRDVNYLLKEGKTLNLSFLFGWGSYEMLRGGIEADINDIWGLAHRARIKGIQSFKSSSGEFTYTIPESVGKDTDLFFNAWGLRREEVSFTRLEYGGGLGLHRYFQSAATDVSARYNYQILGAQQFTTFEEIATDGLTNPAVGSVIFEVKHDRRDNPLYPHRGYKVFATIETATAYLGGEANYERIEIAPSWHHPLGGGRYISLGLSHGVDIPFGSVANNLPFNKRFFPGGDNSIRGYEEGEASPRNEVGQIVGAETYLLGTVELEQALTPKWSIVLFSDNLGFARRIANYPFDTGLYSVGGGIRWHTLIGPVRLEYGYNLNPRPGDPSGTLLFSLGYPF